MKLKPAKSGTFVLELDTGKLMSKAVKCMIIDERDWPPVRGYYEGIWGHHTDLFRGYSQEDKEWKFGTLVTGEALQGLFWMYGFNAPEKINPGLYILDWNLGKAPKTSVSRVVQWSVGMMISKHYEFISPYSFNSVSELFKGYGMFFEGDIVRARGLHPDMIGIVERRDREIPFMVHMYPSRTLKGFPEWISLNDFDWEKAGTFYEDGKKLLNGWGGQPWEEKDEWAELEDQDKW